MGSFLCDKEPLMINNVIQCQQVSKSYGRHRVLDAIDMEVPEGMFFGLVGMNGSGKSTMIKSMLDLTAIDHGSIDLFGEPHRRVSARARVAYLPDRFSPPIHLKSRDFIQYMLRLHRSRKSDEEVHNMLEALGLDRSVMESSVRSLSKGMTQKLGLASCLLSDKSLMLLDEPMSGLDPMARVLFKKQLFEMKRRGVTLFFSSHVLADVEELADRMAVLHENRILFQGACSDFRQKYNGSSLEDAYIRCVGKAV
jgi:ABC-type multidrug transport system ATPase subunit